MLKRTGIAFLLLLSMLPYSHAITSTSTWDTIVWTVSGATDVYLSSQSSAGGYVNLYYFVDVPVGATLTVDAKVYVRDTSKYVNARMVSVSIPNAGTQYITRRTITATGTPIENPIGNKNSGRFVPYQKVPATDPRYQTDKWILIDSSGYEADSTLLTNAAFGGTAIFIAARQQVMAGDEGLKKYVDYEPSEVISKPKGCNGCSAMGLPGYRVNMQSRRLLVQDPIFSYQGLGPKVDITLSYNSASNSPSSSFGRGWRMNLDQWLSLIESGVNISQGSGGNEFFPVPRVIETGYTDVVLITNVTSEPFTYADRYDRSASGDKLIYSNQSENTWTVFRSGTLLKEIYSRGTNDNSAVLPMARLEDWNGNAIRIDRNPGGVITQLVDAVGRKTRFQLTGSGYCTNIILPNGKTASFAYDASGNLIQTTDLAGNVTDYGYESPGIMTNMTTEGREWAFSWITDNGEPRIYLVRNPNGDTSDYSGGGAVDATSTAVDFTGKTNEYTLIGTRKKGSTRPHTATVNGYNHFGFPTNVTTYHGGTRFMEYDTNGLISVYQNAGGWKTYFGFTPDGLLSTLTNSLGGVWHLQYDNGGNVLSVTSPANRSVHMTYDGYGRRLSYADGNTNITTYTYDAYGNLKTKTAPSGAQTVYFYDVDGINLTAITDPNGHTTSYEYDDNRRLTRITYADGTSKQFLYDCCAQTGLVNERGDQRSVVRDKRLNTVTEEDFMGNRIRNTYDGESRLLSSTNALGHSITYTYDELGRLSTVTDALGNRSSREYPGYNLYKGETRITPTDLSFQDYAGNWSNRVITYRFNGEAQIIRAGPTWYIPDALGRPERKLMPSAEQRYWHTNDIIFLDFDADGLCTGKRLGGLLQFTRTFDAAMNLRTVTHALGTDRYTPNTDNALVRINYFDGTQVQQTYDPAGNLTNITYPGGISVTLQYDARNRPTSLNWASHWIAASYDDAGYITREDRSNGTFSEYYYDSNSDITNFSHARNSDVLVAMTLSRNQARQLVQREQTAGLISMRPTASQAQHQMTYTPEFQVRTRDGILAGADDNFNLTNLPGTSGFSATYYLDGRPQQIQINTNTIGFVYGDQAKPIKVTKNNEDRFLHYDRQQRLLFITDAANQVLQLFVYMGNMPVAMISGSHTYWYHYDQRGNTQFLTDEQARIAAIYKYLPYGMQGGSYSRIDNPFTFAGRFGVYDLGDGLYNMGQRLYAAQAHRFLTPDTLGFGGGINPMVYAYNNPIGFVDPGGYSGIYSEYKGYGGDEGGGYIPTKKPITYKGNVGDDLKGCYMKMENIAAMGSEAIGKLKIVKELSEEKYGDAAYDGLGAAVSGTSAMVYNFLMIPGNSNGNYDKERAMEKKLGERHKAMKEQQDKDRAQKEQIDSYLRKNYGTGYGGFSVDAPTFPQFSLEPAD